MGAAEEEAQRTTAAQRVAEEAQREAAEERKGWGWDWVNSPDGPDGNGWDWSNSPNGPDGWDFEMYPHGPGNSKPVDGTVVVLDGREFEYITVRHAPTGEAALTEEAERLFKVVAPGRDRDACETNRLHRIIKASKEMVDRMASYPKWNAFVESLSEEDYKGTKWRVDRRENTIIPKAQLIDEFVNCLGDLDINGDGVIDDDEYATAVRAGLVTAALDLDGDGIIDESRGGATQGSIRGRSTTQGSSATNSAKSSRGRSTTQGSSARNSAKSSRGSSTIRRS